MRKIAAAGALALAVTLTGCGNIGTEGQALFGDTQELVRVASGKTQEVSSAKYTFEMSMLGQQFTGSGQGRFGQADVAMSMTMQVMGQTMEMRVVDRVMYMKLPPGAGASDKPWVKVSADGTDPMSKSIGEMLDMSAKQSDPRKMLEYVQQAGTITRSEKTQLDGQEVSHYWIDIDMAKAGDQLPPGMTKDMFEQMKGKLGVVPMELWLNGDQLPVQVTMDLSSVMKAALEQQGMSPDQAGGGGKMTMKFSEWGAPVTVEAPPAAEVGEFKMPR
ncbi:hypothetical protein [Amycolatopsis suaedae]|uniref:LppX_LprAFG lipoprotein n=1 Tax=Amycolatopsis suaedae TaxID=2510978 RepID=A0A4Q7J1I5_9PSEU|nr:hypothetical protein [Amycolatopsis suaedae]RZQ60719.1 hypothetical protein EWH70_26760 [Amycolatopsis suaedae]